MDRLHNDLMRAAEVASIATGLDPHWLTGAVVEALIAIEYHTISEASIAHALKLMVASAAEKRQIHHAHSQH
jgi:hypothetical protein